MTPKLVSVLMVTHNDAGVLPKCLESLQQQDYPSLECIIVDNGSRDDTRDILSKLTGAYQTFLNETNCGFAASQNQALRHAQGDWILFLNPDVILSRNFISELAAAAEADPSIGMASGKLLRWSPAENQPLTNVIDSTGIYFRRNLRHLDRGSEEVDRGQYDQPAFVFGVTGAAALHRRRMVEDVSVMGEFLDADFFLCRDDADLAWRAHLMGWRCIYTPRALGWHVRRVTPARFRELPLVVNWHSVKNRFIMRWKNISPYLYLRLFLPVTWRDCMILGYSVLVDRRLFSAFTHLWRNRKAISAKRKWIQDRRRVSDRELAKWFSDLPASFPLSALEAIRSPKR
ncbi:MAG TPA: glycosyltransferase family 2 protein [Terriglobia bacterium]|nr:glycosyltransferase family 2 protein [Terriglobia bacterium]